MYCVCTYYKISYLYLAKPHLSPTNSVHFVYMAFTISLRLDYANLHKCLRSSYVFAALDYIDFISLSIYVHFLCSCESTHSNQHLPALLH